MITAAKPMTKSLTQTVGVFSKSRPMAEGRSVASSDQLHWSFHKNTHADGGGSGWYMQEREQRCLTAVDNFGSKLPGCTDIFDVLFHEGQSCRPRISIPPQIKILAVHGQSLLYRIQICLKCLFSLFCFYPSEASCSNAWFMSTRLNGAVISAFHWLFYFQRVQAFETLNKKSLWSVKIKASIDLVLRLKYSLEGPEILQNCRLELSTWNWSTGPTSTTEALELKAMWGNLQRPETRLSWSPTPPPPPWAISACAQLSFNSAEHGSRWAAHVWRWDRAPEVMSVGWDIKLGLNFEDQQLWQSWKCHSMF